MKPTQPETTTHPNTAPTWYGDIQKLFTKGDIACMQSVFGTAFNLGSYQFVATHADQIDQVTSSGYMPKGGTPWTQSQVTTFRNWMATGYQEGSQALAAAALAITPAASAPTRIRKDVRSLSTPEIATLLKAFTGIMALPATDTNSYFYLAAIHWLPAPSFWCMHHDPGFLPWHRAYQIVFENALRSIEGCENVTIPYWDITMTDPLPDWLYKAPFASYKFPQDVGPAPYTSGYVTQRNSPADILTNLKGDPTQAGSDVFTDVSTAMTQVTWEGFNGFFAGADYDTLIAGHDNGHNATGNTMADQSVAAFDPIFWLFHNNWDRVYWEWQKKYNATTQAGMLSRIAKDQASYDTFTDAVAGQLAPFTAINPRFNAKDLLNLNDWDIDYAAPVTKTKASPVALGHKAIHAAEPFTLDLKRVHVRIDGVNRLRIPGSFRVKLMNGEKVIGTRVFFQPSNSKECANCIKNAIAHFDFKLPAEAVAGGKLSFSIELTTVEPGKKIPVASLGTPTIQALIPLTSAR